MEKTKYKFSLINQFLKFQNTSYWHYEILIFTMPLNMQYQSRTISHNDISIINDVLKR